MASILGKVRLKLTLITNKINKTKQCYICKTQFARFTKHRGGSKNIPDYLKALAIIGTDADNFRCMYCKGHDRERHLFMFFDKLKLWDKMKDAKVLHFAPERNLWQQIQKQNPALFIKADLYPRDSTQVKMDATDIPYPENTFDVIICNHVMEHIPDYGKALREFLRVLKPGGFAVIQAPYSKLLKVNYEVKNADTDALRYFYYGQTDHVRILSEDHYFNDIKKAGLRLEVVKNAESFTEKECAYYGVNNEEDFVMAFKP